MKSILRNIAFVFILSLFTNTASQATVLGGEVAPANAGQTVVTAANSAKDKAAAEQLYQEAWHVIDDNFLHRDRLKDWGNWQHRFDGKLNNEAEAVTAINQMLDTLKEDYTYYKSPSVVQYDQKRSAKTNVVSSKMLAGNVGYIKIDTFSSNNTADEVEAAMKALSGATSYVIDLRDNRGGFVQQAFEVFSLLVDKGTFTVMKGHYNGSPYKEEYVVKATQLEDITNGSVTVSARRSNLSGNKPVVVLVNADSASASEMIAGALRDNGRATIIGTKTYGKGIAQITRTLGNTAAVQVTYAEYFFPKGANIHKLGLTPDQVVNQKSGTDSQLDEAIHTIEKQLKK